MTTAKLTRFFVNGNVAALTRTVSNMMAKPYEYGTCKAESPSFKTSKTTPWDKVHTHIHTTEQR